jgi:YHS domain-containing protein
MIDTEMKATGSTNDDVTQRRIGDGDDPVCHMDVDLKRAAAQSSQGRGVHFCAIGCKTKFDADPGRYLPASK